MLDERFMNLALNMARTTEGQTAPNPVVGAVLVKNNQVVGMGAHLKAGEPHAERHALAMAGRKAEGSTCYVTLEPCSHYGRTPPCADALIDAKVERVVIATRDPNPKVAGRGIEKLKEAGILITEGVMEKEAQALNRTFFHFIKHRRPFVTLKSATSIDGKIATSTGESKWITGPEARLNVHQLRHENDGILVGVKTVIADDPLLTTRLPGGGKHPVRIVLDHSLNIPVTASLVTDRSSPTWVVTSGNHNAQKKEELESAGVRVLPINAASIEIEDVLNLLGELGIMSLLVEGGGHVNDSFLRSGLFDQVVVYLAPLIIGGQNALSSFSGTGIERLSDGSRLKIKSAEMVGKDLKVTAVKEER
ncbi:bifunctional diaminohydroxyphosphoribosylaminopyrimidine deaminase/5-amino-6-(5-phosphoribosylamino)uracil reductase RibD [Bacillus sp. H-16]|uniref:bifunctional diaminohydroxyphosphoribosylaminopyrimidine deaminase/5-amino-6-(5-phosphoribosylamino)uracil reductase RibD n=1 Tax=Alteribacter salitolerans TaxID=2912333 RepID=UPI001963A9D7|nr:bifunctional diaminohydroxyphosphoribosylaminopyrimidine deaminase/5-amino-6-(5-phosphoribosylamino)uracil reductase RibD [Alteribacter salitolerans]MBM7094731.1 bifunctional diaminohydroxyphosphoribosylaminopyrimidine deaminase/5-amino-6-(5-phosphoribosylamino)uracil reductase RibD [Alteribacter salitolerans]